MSLKLAVAIDFSLLDFAFVIFAVPDFALLVSAKFEFVKILTFAKIVNFEISMTAFYFAPIEISTTATAWIAFATMKPFFSALWFEFLKTEFLRTAFSLSARKLDSSETPARRLR